MSIPAGTAVIVLLLGVFPWVALYFVHKKIPIVAWIMGVFVSPYRMATHEAEKAELRAIIEKQKSDILRMTEIIQVSTNGLDKICNRITAGKGEKGVPLDSRFDLLETVHDLIREPVIKQLELLLPNRSKDV